MRSQKSEEAKEGMELQVRCGDVGVDCDYVAHGRTEEELFKNAAEHGKSAHKMEQIPPEIVEKVRAATRYKSRHKELDFFARDRSVGIKVRKAL